MAPTRIVALAGGVGGSRFARGLRAAAPEAELTVIVNSGDDVTLHGLRVSPDVDTVLYALSGAVSLSSASAARTITALFLVSAAPRPTISSPSSAGENALENPAAGTTSTCTLNSSLGAPRRAAGKCARRLGRKG